MTLAFRRFSWSGFGQLMGLFIGPSLEAWERIDVTREGIVRRDPFRRHEVRWKDAKAIFREGTKDKRSFVIVGPDAAIHVPAHLAIDRHLMEKVLYSLPDPILCVNFDETTLRGYRRRETAKSKSEAVPDLLPTLTG